VLVPYQEFLNSDGFELAASLGDAMEDHVAAEVFRRNASDTTLIRVTVLAVPAWIVCRTRSAYLRFVRDWIGRLIELNRADPSYQLLEVMSHFFSEVASILEEVALTARRAPAKNRKPGHRGSPSRPERAPERASKPSVEGSI